VTVGRLDPQRFAEVVAARREEDHDPVSSLCRAA
jgi:hypothetical protein